MLEEALSSTTYSPAEAALTFISFLEVELAAGGAAAESRFFKLFSMLCDRVFGVLSMEEGFKHQIGGWLSRQAKWERPNTSVSSQGYSPHYRIPQRNDSSSNNRSDPVIKLLGARAITNSTTSKDQQQPLTLIEAFAKEAEHRPNVRYPFPFEAFPKSTQEAWIALIDAALGGSTALENPPSENLTRLLGSLFRVKPLEQIGLRQYQQAKALQKDNRRPLQLSPMQFQSRSPMSPLATQGSTPTKEKDSHPMINLSMLEYYLVVFIRYPLAPAPLETQPTQTKTATTATRSGVTLPAASRRTEPYGELVYHQLYQEYINYYVPSKVPQGQSNGFAPLQRPSELFIRITVNLWMEGQNSLWPTAKAVKDFQERRGAQTPVDLNTSFDLVRTKYDPPPYQISRSLHKLVARAVSDGAIMDMAQDMYAGYRGANPEILCLSPTMTILQLPFFNYIRGAFRHASIHVQQSPFYAALNDWLVWLEPWNTRHEKGRVQTQRIMNSVSRTHAGSTTPSSRVTYPKATQRSTYKDCWEPYIASNLHLYTVPLALFLRRSRELDFSPREDQRSLNTVQRVFRVFSPQVVAFINKLLQKEAGSKWSSVVARHESNLGVFVPPKCERGLASCQDDMQNLLEEMYLQHMKKVDSMDIVDRSIAFIESFFGGGAYAGEEKELRLVISKAKTIVTFPNDFDVIPSKSRLASDSQDRSLDSDRTADRVSTGFFSDSGLEKISTGATKCNPLEIGYFGDRMLSRPGSHEIALLIPWLVNISNFLNSRLGLQVRKEDGFARDESLIPKRVNLRFLADYRNLVFMTLCYWLLKFIWG